MEWRQHNGTQPKTHSLLIDRLLHKRALMQRGEPAHAQIKTALLIDGGGMRGVYGGGVVIALEQQGLLEVFDYAIGISSGAADCAYFLSGQSEFGTAIYYEDLASKRFIDLKRVSKILDIDYLDPSLP